MKQALLDYNRQDCEALELVANKLVDLHRAVPADGTSSRGELVLTSDMKRASPYGFKSNEFVFPEMDAINKAAYWDYQRERVYVKSHTNSARKAKRHTIRRNKLTPNTTDKTIEYSRPTVCPTCCSNLSCGHGQQSTTIVDLRFMCHGIKRWIVRQAVRRYRCPSCRSTFYPPDYPGYQKKYGHNLIAYILY